jgi:hypothetical protein
MNRFSVLLLPAAAQFFAPCQYAEHGFFPQLLVIVDVFISQRQTVDPLCEPLQNRMLHLLLIPAIEKALGQLPNRFKRLSARHSRNAPPAATNRQAT